MVKVQMTDKDLEARGDFFAEGEHEVTIVTAQRGKTDAGKEFIEFDVAGKDGEEGTARLWFTTEKSCKYALSIMAGIATHNKKTEEDKAKARAAFRAITDTDQVDDKFLEKFSGMEAFYQVSMSDRTYVNDAGETKNSYDKNIYGYMPKPKRNLIAEAKEELSKPIDLSEIPFGE